MGCNRPGKTALTRHDMGKNRESKLTEWLKWVCGGMDTSRTWGLVPLNTKIVQRHAAVKWLSYGPGKSVGLVFGTGKKSIEHGWGNNAADLNTRRGGPRGVFTVGMQIVFQFARIPRQRLLAFLAGSSISLRPEFGVEMITRSHYSMRALSTSRRC